MAVIWVALGGACGAVLRFGVSRALVGTSMSFPLATLIVNVVGSFLIGLLAAGFLSGAGNPLSGEKIVPEARLFFQTGLLGAFTTFSAFSLETMNLWQSGQNKAALINVLANLILSLLAVTLGMIVGSAYAARLR